jgi:predicted nucleotidyltransferase
MLTEFFFKIDFVTVAYLFGSTVRGEANCLSDSDIAVLFDDNFSKEEDFNFQLELIGELTFLLKTNNVDLVTLNDW